MARRNVMGVKRIITPSSEALKSNSLRMAPDLSEVVMNRMPKVSDWWIFAWPISRMNASYRARISVSEEVMPGLSSPEILIWIISILLSIAKSVKHIIEQSYYYFRFF